MGGRHVRRVLAAVFLLLLLLPVVARAQEAVVFLPDVQIAAPSGFSNAYLSDLAVAGSEVRATWVGQRTYGSYGWGYSVSHDGGRTFSSSPAPGGAGQGSTSARVATLPDGRFAYLWAEPGNGLLAAVEDADGSFRWSSSLATNETPYLDIGADETGVYTSWIDYVGGAGRLMIGELDPDSLRLTRYAVVASGAYGFSSNVRVSVREGVLGIVWISVDYYAYTTAVMFSHAGTDLNASSPVSVSESGYWSGGFPRVAVGPGGIAFVMFAQPYANDPVGAWTALPPDYDFEFFTGLEDAIGASRIDDLAAEFDSQGRMLLVWVDGQHGLVESSVRFTRASSGLSQFLPLTRLDVDYTRSKGGLAVAANEEGRVYVAWSTWGAGSDSDVHVAREVQALPPPEPASVLLLSGVLGMGVVGAASVVFLLRRSRRKPRPEQPSDGTRA